MLRARDKMLGAGFARNRTCFAASMTSPLYLVRADGAARLRRSAAPSADIWRFAEIDDVGAGIMRQIALKNGGEYRFIPDGF